MKDNVKLRQAYKTQPCTGFHPFSSSIACYFHVQLLSAISKYETTDSENLPGRLARHECFCCNILPNTQANVSGRKLFCSLH